MQITVLPPDNGAGMNALEIAGELQQESTILEVTVIERRRFECPDIECGAVFSYRRVSCGHFVPPNFCPTCGGSMETTENSLMTIMGGGEYSSERLSDCRQLQGQQAPQLLG